MNRIRTIPLWATMAAACLAACAPAVAQDFEKRRGFSITITAPANQQIVVGKTRITAEVKIADPEDVDRVEFFIGDDLIFVDREAPWECVHDFGESSQSFIIRAVAHHREELTVSDAVITRKLRFATFEKVNRVLLWVSVTEKKDRLVTDMKKEELRVLEDGDEKQILEFYREDRPITMAILIDTSGSMDEEMKEVHGAAEAFVETLRPDDQALVIDFDDRVFLIQDLTSDHEALKEAVTSTEPLGATALYDALHAAYRKIGTIEGRRAIVLLSDGSDTSSQFGYERVLEEAKSNNTMIFAIGLGGGFLEIGRRNVLKEFAEYTGGRAFFVDKASELAGVYQRIAEELRAQYFLAYSTDIEEWDGRWIKLQVDSTRPDTKVRARRGFFAVKAAR
jgi:Ca-activated chloride channel family protein